MTGKDKDNGTKEAKTEAPETSTEGTNGTEIENKAAEDTISDADETTEELTPDEAVSYTHLTLPTRSSV